MSGLIWGGIGKGISDAGSTAGQMMFKASSDEENRQWKEEQNAMYRRAVGPAAGGGSGGGGAIGFKDLGEAGAGEETLAGLAGMSVPEMRDISRRTKQGDYSKESAVTTLDDNEGEVTQMVKSYPPGFEAEVKDKAKELAKLRESQVLAGKYGDVTKGRQTMQEVQGTEDILSGKKSAGVVGTAIAGGQGKDLYGGDSNVTRQKFTGETGTTDVGKSQITENLAQASRAKSGGADGGTDKIFKTITGADGIEYGITRSGNKIPLGESGSFNKSVAAEISKMEKNNYSFGQLSEEEKRAKVLERLTPSPKAEPKSDNQQTPEVPKRGVWNPKTQRVEWK